MTPRWVGPVRRLVGDLFTIGGIVISAGVAIIVVVILVLLLLGLGFLLFGASSG